jgi:PAS domain S-box-containing protein
MSGRKAKVKIESTKSHEIEGLLHSIFDLVAIGICITDAKGIIVDVNSEYCRIYGYKKDELIGLPFVNFVPIENRAVLQKLHDDFIDGTEELAAEWKVQRKDGSLIDIYASAKLLVYENGGRFKITSIRDISENKKYHNLLTEAQEKAHLGGWGYDAHSEELSWTDEVFKIFEIPDQRQVELNRMFSFFRDEAHLAIKQAFALSLEKGDAFDLELLASTTGDNKIWIRVTCKPIRIHNKTVKLYGTIQNVTSRINNERAIYASEQKYRAAFQNSMTGFFVTNPDGKIIDANEAACKMFGYTLEEIKEIGRQGIIDPTTSGLNEMLAEREKNGQVSGELYCIRKNGQIFPTEFTSSLYEIGDGDLYSTTLMQDISNRKKRDHHLKLLESVLTNTDDSVLITKAEPLDAPGPIIIYANDAYSRMTGYSIDEVLGKSPRILQGDKSDFEVLKKVGEKLRRSEPCQFETINYKKNGEEFWNSSKITPVFDEHGKHTHWFSVQRDITDFKIKELRRKLMNDISQAMNSDGTLRDSLKTTLLRLSSVIEFDFGEVWMPNLDKKFLNLMAKLAMNKKAEYFYDLNTDELAFSKGKGLPGKVWENMEVVHWNDVDKRKAFHRKEAANKSGIKSAYGFPLIHNSEFVGVLLLGLSRKVLVKEHFVSIIGEISEHLSAEIKRKQLEEELERIFSFAPDIICVTGMDGYFKKVNPAMSKILGYSMDELLQHPITHFVHPDDYKKTTQEISAINKKRGHSTFENRYLTKDGRAIWLSWATTILYEEGLIYSVAKDITENKRNELALKNFNIELEKHAEELAASNAELEQFAYVASHDLQEPLRMVTSFLSQIEKKYNPLLDEKGKQYIHFAVDGAQRMRSIILDLLEYSRIGRTEKEISTFSFSEIIEDVEALFNKLIQDTNASLLYQDLPEITAIRVTIRQLLQNLVGNALKFRDSKRNPVIKIKSSETKTHWKFSVSDNGIGINENHLERIFVIFQRLNSREEFEGSGIGLAICRKIVENHGGKIWVESTEGEGSTFFFTIKKP